MLREVNGWQLDVSQSEALVRDTDLAERLEYKQPRMVRKLIGRLIKSGEIAAVLQRDVVERSLNQHGAEREYTVQEYWLTEKQALSVCMHSKTTNAMHVRNEVIDVFVEVRHGMLPSSSDKKFEAMMEAVALMTENVSRAVASMDNTVARMSEHSRATEAKIFHEIGVTSSKVDALDAEIKDARRDIADLSRMAKEFPVKRVAPKAKDVLLHIEFVQSAYHGKCPHCFQTDIVRDGNRLPACQIDHFLSRNNAKLSATWAICERCNRGKEPSESLSEYSDTFRTYQAKLDRYLERTRGRQLALSIG